MRRSLKLALIALCLLLLLGAFFLWYGGPGGDDVLVSRPQGTGKPSPGFVPEKRRGLFVFGNPYLDGRSEWVSERFKEFRRGLSAVPTPSKIEADCKVPRALYTQGEWVGQLTEELTQHREETEKQAVHSIVTFFVKGASPQDVLLFLAAADFIERVPGEGEIVYDALLDPEEALPDDLKSPPSLLPNEWLARQSWKRPLAYPTAIYYINAAFREGETWVLVYEAWRNFGDETHAVIRFGSGQYALLQREGGTLVRLTSYFSGQKIPPLMEGFVVSLTASFSRKLAKVIQDEASTWKPSPKVVERFTSLGLY